ncbi:MAG: ABC transporter permease [Spirochaetaceae bacterium]|nr:ABC transporter permease [Spirochaetaceae bacterium]
MSERTATPAASATGTGTRGRRSFVRRLLRDRSTTLPLLFLLALVSMAAGADLFTRYDPLDPVAEPLQPPSGAFPIGTDEIGRDILTRVVYASRITLAVGVMSSVGALLIGVPLGLLAGWFGRFTDAVVMRAMDSVLSIPPLLLALVMVSVLGSNVFVAMLAIVVVFIPHFVRISRAEVLSLRNQEFVLAAQAIGMPTWRLLLGTILRNAISPVMVQFSLVFSRAVIVEAGLSFLGLGAQPPTPTWGNMLNTGRGYLYYNTLYAIIPGVAIFLTVLSLNIVGDSLRDRLDPRDAGLIKEDNA